MAENGLEKCCKCNCLFKPSDNSMGNSKSTKPKVTDSKDKPKEKAISESSCKCSGDSGDNEGIVVRPSCQSDVQILVKACDGIFCTKCSSSASATEDKPKKPKKDQKNVCIRLCTKKKGGKKGVQTSATKTNGNVDDGNQTSRTSVNKLNLQEMAEAGSLKDVLKSLPPCCRKGCGGCNTNTIIFPPYPTPPQPEARTGGDGSGANLESLIKHEFATFTRSLDEILTTLTRQKQELRDVRDTVDMVLRYMREQFLASKDTKTKLDWRENDVDKKKSLERKSNTTSINDKSEEKVTQKKFSKLTTVPPEPIPEKVKKKTFWERCKYIKTKSP